MSIKAAVTLVVLGLLVGMSGVLMQAEPAEAQECRLVRIIGMAQHASIRTEPETLMIDKGTCVIWFNRASATDVKIVFEDGKKCSSVTDAPVGFSLDHEQCYVTSWIPFAGTSSLRFMESGSYAYVIEKPVGQEGLEGQKVAKGTIVVK